MGTLSAQWWGFSKDHGWVILDRDLACNTPGTRGELMFFRCRDEKIFMLGSELWKLPAYQFAANYLKTLPPDTAADTRAEYDGLVSRWPELQRELKRQYQEIVDAKAKGRDDEEKREKSAAAERKKQRTKAERASKVAAAAED